MGTIKNRNSRDLVEGQEIKKRWKESMEELYKKKDLNELDKNNGMVSHPDPDILECEVSRALGSTAVKKVSGCDGIPVELFKTLKDDATRMLGSICQQIWKTQQWPQAWKRSSFIPVPKKGSTKECSNHQTVAFISHASKVMLKILHGRLQNFQMSSFQLNLFQLPDEPGTSRCLGWV